MSNSIAVEEYGGATPEQRRGIWMTVAVLLLFMVMVLAGFLHKMSQPRVLTDSELRANGAVKLERPRILDDFQLVADSGEPFYTQDLNGRWTLIFFGFTHCPDICPTTLATLNHFYQLLDDKTRADTDILLVSVDPKRDSPEQLRDYVRYFNAEFRGVTGEFLQLKRFANQLNVPFNKVPLENGTYTVDHGSQVVLLNPRGHYHAFFKAPLDPAKMKLTYRSMRAAFKG
ncbi:SCO family protein [Microbulbifer thermotolerans]|uniref:Electron transporter SenC n=1 Tax=Microbulbifer thermotolerans TaxID=252514 RepID=A0A143HIB8_MICTH|nr:SCO family protein [Microbulbifer thermotolerans]AMX01220.1 electron transporter SenC [Microbulbifer thermotolerans]MCX2778462.1 SCO family protein [Microbulbifer thermotolerans]MCX2793946.1 SCO family protein [Microbulbifer thermotolerans]MCX2804029.1 SCO family protein [Microbulbifer thermotolerans]MCX2833462.1 SCO family protein [Microbulbifer thermotolerans]